MFAAAPASSATPAAAAAASRHHHAAPLTVSSSRHSHGVTITVDALALVCFCPVRCLLEFDGVLSTLQLLISSVDQLVLVQNHSMQTWQATTLHYGLRVCQQCSTTVDLHWSCVLNTGDKVCVYIRPTRWIKTYSSLSKTS